MTHSTTNTINAYVGPSSSPNVVIYQYTNPEIVLTNLILEYLTKVGFNDLLPNYANVRVGAEHPFINFLYNDEQGLSYDFNLLPSITLTDSSGDETLDTLSVGFENEIVDTAYVDALNGGTFNPSNNQGFLVTSTQNIARLKSATANGTILSGKKRWMTQRHIIEMSIWAEDKNVSSLLYDAVNTFTLDYMDQLHLLGIDFAGISGKRSGDFNLDFGRLLYGSSVVMNAFVRVGVVEVDLETGVINSIKVNPTYTGA